MQLAKLHQRLTNQRNDFLHKLSRYYVNNYDLIVIEDLNVKGMTKDYHLAQSILDASWSKFFGMPSYKAESAGKIVVKVNPRGTSKEYTLISISHSFYFCSPAKSEDERIIKPVQFTSASLEREVRL